MCENIRDSFLNDIGNYYSNDVMPSKISINMRRALSEHKKRLQSKGITYSARFEHSEDDRSSEVSFRSIDITSDRRSGQEHKVAGFKMTNSYRHCNAVTEMSDGTRNVKCDEASDDVVYCHIIDREDPAAPADEDIIIECPNCGHTGAAKIFVDGCPMCSTKFEINDLYPCVNSYYYMPWPMPKPNFVDVALKRGKTAGFIVGPTIGFFTFLLTLVFYKNPILPLILGIGVTLFTGWIAFLITFFIGQAIATTQSVAGVASMAANTLDMTAATNSKRKTEEAIKPYDPDFVFDIFEGKIISSIRTIAYSDDRSGCSLYAGKDDLSFMDDLIDVRYRGALRFDKAVLSGDYLHVVMTAYLDNIYYKDGTFLRGKENFTMELVRKKEARTPVQFTAYSVNCKNCAGTFDAILSKKCPFCGQEYELASQDWTIIQLVKTK